MAELPIAFQSYESRSLPYSAQRLINLYYEMGVDGTKTGGVLFRRPGQELVTTLDTGPTRGIHVMNNVTFVVAGTVVYTIDQAGVATALSGTAVGGTDLVDMDDNGSQVAIVASNLGFIATTSDVIQITDEGFRSVTSVVFQDGFFIWTETNSARFFLSPLFNGIGPYDTLDFATAEYAPDNLVKVFSDHGDLFLLGDDSIEPWRNSGNVDFPFVPLSGAAMEVGLIARNTVQKLDNSLIWFGRDERGGNTVWRASGYSPQRISTHALESKWDQLMDLDQAYAFTFRYEGHAFYVLTVPDRGTWVYDASTTQWCEFQTNGREDWVVVGFGSASGRRFVGSRVGNELYDLKVDAFDDDGEAIIWQATSPPVATENNSLARHNFLRIDAGTGVGLTLGGDPEIFISWADEDGERFNSPKLMSLGALGDTRKRMFRRRLGQARSRTYRLQGSDPVALSLIGAYVDIEGGTY